MTADDRTAADRKFVLDVLDRVMGPQQAFGDALKVLAIAMGPTLARAVRRDMDPLGPTDAPWAPPPPPEGVDPIDPLIDPLSTLDAGIDMGPQVGWLVQAHNRVVGWLPFDTIEAVTIYDARRAAQDPNLTYARVIPVYADGTTSTLRAKDLL